MTLLRQIWFMQIFPRLKKHTSQEPGVTEYIFAVKFTCFGQNKLKTLIELWVAE